ncbi:MAG: hypothetical protein QGH45_13710, partial [Myxococcota bacterium]|nr:hypothetical protein [Myxococcota bacterium]
MGGIRRWVPGDVWAAAGSGRTGAGSLSAGVGNDQRRVSASDSSVSDPGSDSLAAGVAGRRAGRPPSDDR